MSSWLRAFGTVGLVGLALTGLLLSIHLWGGTFVPAHAVNRNSDAFCPQTAEDIANITGTFSSDWRKAPEHTSNVPVWNFHPDVDKVEMAVPFGFFVTADHTFHSRGYPTLSENEVGAGQWYCIKPVVAGSKSENGALSKMTEDMCPRTIDEVVSLFKGTRYDQWEKVDGYNAPTFTYKFGSSWDPEKDPRITLPFGIGSSLGGAASATNPDHTFGPILVWHCVKN